MSGYGKGIRSLHKQALLFLKGDLMMDKTVATTILEQLGGRRFMIMTGIKDFFTTKGNDLCMRLGRNQSRANQLRIEYDYGKDLYTMRFIRYTAPRLKVNSKLKTAEFTKEKITEVRTFEDVYCDQLEEIFREVTGLETRMPRIVGLNA